jgi:SAM-dependent methyltransferase
MQSLYVQYGSGLCAPARWRNFDSSPTLRIERSLIFGPMKRLAGRRLFPPNVEVGDIVSGLPVAQDSCAGIYCSHVLEHLSLQDFRKALANTHRYLVPGGTFRFVLPDMRHYIQTYMQSDSPGACRELMESSRLGRPTRPRGLVAFVKEWLGNSHHLWMWDYPAIATELEQAGFRDIRRASFGDARDPLFHDVEEAGRWENCLGVECLR